MKLRDAVDGYLLFKAGRSSPETIRTDRCCLDQFIDWRGDVEADALTSEDVRAYLAYHTERGLSPYTIRRHHATLCAFCAWLCSPEIGLADENPARKVPPPKLPKLKPKALEREDIEAILAATEKANTKRRAKALVLFLLDTGARASEVVRVTMAGVDFRSGKVKVRGKGDKERFVYLGRRALSALWLYVKDERPEPAQVGNDHLFLTYEGYPMTRHTLRGIIVRLGKAARVRASPHQFRHTAAIEHLRHGMDLVSLQHLLGHADITTTRGYLEALQDEDVEERAKRTSPADNWRL